MLYTKPVSVSAVVSTTTRSCTCFVLRSLMPATRILPAVPRTYSFLSLYLFYSLPLTKVSSISTSPANGFKLASHDLRIRSAKCQAVFCVMSRSRWSFMAGYPLDACIQDVDHHSPNLMGQFGILHRRSYTHTESFLASTATVRHG